MRALDEIICNLAPSVRVIAIDGRSASGKTTLAAELAMVTGGSVIHMDDFFLPPALRTEERFHEAGGNVHYERFIDEVLPGLESHSKFLYHRFDCSKMDYYESLLSIDASGIVIVEGAYSLSPRFGHYYDLSVFLDIEPEEQIRRIMKRNGEEKAKVFQSRWIPLEEAYFKTYGVEKNADLRFSSLSEEHAQRDS